MTDQALAARLTQLEQAKSLVEADASYFPQIVVGVLPVFDDPFVELRRWVADFVLLAMSSRKLSAEDKQELALKCLEKLSVSTTSEQDVTAAKSFIQISTIIYPLIFRYVANNPQSSQVWKNLTILKTAILRFWDADGEGLKICCVKFAQRVVAAQSVGSKDPRLANKEDVSLNIVIADHPLLIERDLNAEAQALLDRIILVLQERPADPVLMVAATNCLCVLAKVRLTFTPKIIGAILSCDLSNIVDINASTKAKLQVKFVEKAIRVTLTHLLKINAAGSFGNKIQQYLLGRAKKTEDENVRKRQASEPVDNAGKRLRTDIDGAGTPQPSVLSIPPLPEGLVSLATIFNLANDNTLASFDVNQLPQSLVVQIILATLTACNQEQLDSSVETIRARHTTVQNRPSTSSTTTTTTALISADSQPGPDLKTNGTSVNVLTPKNTTVQPIVLAPESFEMPAALTLTSEALQKASSGCLERLLHTEPRSRKTSALTIRESGLQKINGGAWDKEAWTGILTRLCARGLSSVHRSKVENAQANIGDKLRSQLLSFVMTNFREHIDFCASWLIEEWYNEQLDDIKPSVQGTYVFWTHKVLDAMIPFLEAKDRIFMRFLSDLPDLTSTMLAKLRNLCVDPDRSQLGYTTLQYLVLLRPPVRTLCLDLVESLYEEDKSESVQQEKILGKWRPGAIIKEEPKVEEI